MSFRSADPGVFDALRRLAGTAIGMVQSRLELASLELGEARDRLIVNLMLAIAAVMLTCGAVLAASAWFVWSLWERTGPGILGWLAASYALAALLLLLWVRTRMRNDPPLLADTVNELRKDASALRADASVRHAAAASGEG